MRHVYICRRFTRHTFLVNVFRCHLLFSLSLFVFWCFFFLDQLTIDRLPCRRRTSRVCQHRGVRFVFEQKFEITCETKNSKKKCKECG